MKGTRSTYLALAAVLLSPMAANADLITQNFGYSNDRTGSLTQGGVDFHTDLRVIEFLALDPFDPTLGTLNSVLFSITSRLDFSGAARFIDDDGIFGPDGVRASGSLAISDLILELRVPELTQLVSSLPDSFDICDDNPLFGFAECSTSLRGSRFSIDPTTYTISGAAVSSYIGTAAASPYIGTGVIDARIQQSGTMVTRLIKGEIRRHDYSLKTSGSINVTYDFTPHDDSPISVPEPGTFALFGIGLLGMGLARRKKA